MCRLCRLALGPRRHRGGNALLAALWVFDHGDPDSMNVMAANARAYQLNASPASLLPLSIYQRRVGEATRRR